MSDLQRTDDHYPTACPKLDETNDDNRRTDNCHLEAFFDQPAITTGTQTSLRTLVACNFLRTSLAFGVNTTPCEAILAFLIFQKLDQDSKYKRPKRPGAYEACLLGSA